MQRLEVSGAVRPLQRSIGVKGLISEQVVCTEVMSPFVMPTTGVFLVPCSSLQCVKNRTAISQDSGLTETSATKIYSNSDNSAPYGVQLPIFRHEKSS